MILRTLFRQCFALFLIQFVHFSIGKLCPSVTNTYNRTNLVDVTTISNQPVTTLVTECPTESDPSTYTECCENPKQQCCPPQRRFYEIDNTLATVIATTVISLCVVLAVLFIVCCFWSKCPLYNTCRVSYRQSDVIALGKQTDEETMGLNNMPAEPNKNKHIYAPSNDNSGSAV